MTMRMENGAEVKIFASNNSWIEGDAINQLCETANLDGMKWCVGFPDLHPGRGTPVGAAFFNGNRIYPHLIGDDAGCGMALFRTSLEVKKTDLEKISNELKNLHLPWGGDVQSWLLKCGLDPTEYDISHGTLGYSNHFAELQVIDSVSQKDQLDKLGLKKSKFVLLVHSGSRGVGHNLLLSHRKAHGKNGLSESSDAAIRYCDAHDFTLKWARYSRLLIAKRFMSQLNGSCSTVLDIFHNSIEQAMIDGEIGWLHRKGAAISTLGPLVISGSRGTLSYLVDPIGDHRENLWSLPHGAGRRWSRGSCRQRLGSKIDSQALCITSLGGEVICDDRNLLFEEAPQAYKDIETVVDDMEKEGLIRVVATLRPVITYKKRTIK